MPSTRRLRHHGHDHRPRRRPHAYPHDLGDRPRIRPRHHRHRADQHDRPSISHRRETWLSTTAPGRGTPVTAITATPTQPANSQLPGNGRPRLGLTRPQRRAWGEELKMSEPRGSMSPLCSRGNTSVTNRVLRPSGSDQKNFPCGTTSFAVHRRMKSPVLQRDWDGHATTNDHAALSPGVS